MRPSVAETPNGLAENLVCLPAIGIQLITETILILHFRILHQTGNGLSHLNVPPMQSRFSLKPVFATFLLGQHHSPSDSVKGLNVFSGVRRKFPRGGKVSSQSCDVTNQL